MAKNRLSRNAIEILKARYLLRGIDGKIKEAPEQMFLRVARHVAKADKNYGLDPRKAEKEFYSMMSDLDFLPNSPTLMNAGTDLGQLSACFVLPLEDSIGSIFQTLKDMALIHKSGGGTGFSFSQIRPRDDIVSSSKGIASGPVSFMKIFDKATDIIKQGGKRRGANMGLLRVDHPDIMEFIAAKDRGELHNFNISVAITDRFMQAVMHGRSFDLINPRTGKKSGRMMARKIFDAIVRNAWAGGEPGVIFIDEINRKNILKDSLDAVNPCGEQPLYPYESCNLGSINLVNMIEDDKVDWEKLRQTVRKAVHFLDNVIDINRFPLKEIERMTLENRKIGLGIMGFADMLMKLNISYSSNEAVLTAIETMRFINQEARAASEEIGRIRGSFPGFKKSRLAKKYRHMRNATVTTIAPTGSISMIAGVSSGIEPNFALNYHREILGGKKMFESHPIFAARAKKERYWGIRQKVSNLSSVQHLKEIPPALRKVFVTALDIPPDQHVRIQAAFQLNTDNAVSKTVNLPNNARIEDARDVFLLAYSLKCKGITLYRYGSKGKQVLNICETC